MTATTTVGAEVEALDTSQRPPVRPPYGRAGGAARPEGGVTVTLPTTVAVPAAQVGPAQSP